MIWSFVYCLGNFRVLPQHKLQDKFSTTNNSNTIPTFNGEPCQLVHQPSATLAIPKHLHCNWNRCRYFYDSSSIRF